MKLIVTLLVIASLIAQPAQCQTVPDKPPGKDSAFIVGCVALAVGGIVLTSLWALCKKIPDPTLDPPPPPQTNTPVTRVNWTNVFGPNWKGTYPPPGWVSPRGYYSSVMQPHQNALATPVPFDVSRWTPSPFSGQHAPLVTNGVFDSYYSVTLMSSTNLSDWEPVTQMFVYQCTSTNFWFESGTNEGVAAVLINAYRGRYDAATNAVPAFSGYHSDWDGLSIVPQDCIQLAGDKREEFFRWVQP